MIWIERWPVGGGRDGDYMCRHHGFMMDPTNEGTWAVYADHKGDGEDPPPSMVVAGSAVVSLEITDEEGRFEALWRLWSAEGAHLGTFYDVPSWKVRGGWGLATGASAWEAAQVAYREAFPQGGPNVAWYYDNKSPRVERGVSSHRGQPLWEANLRGGGRKDWDHMFKSSPCVWKWAYVGPESPLPAKMAGALLTLRTRIESHGVPREGNADPVDCGSVLALCGRALNEGFDTNPLVWGLSPERVLAGAHALALAVVEDMREGRRMAQSAGRCEDATEAVRRAGRFRELTPDEREALGILTGAALCGRAVAQ